jgi:hypothetical protein
MTTESRTTHAADGSTRNHHEINFWAVIRKTLTQELALSSAQETKSTLWVGIYYPVPGYVPFHVRELQEIKAEFDMSWLQIQATSSGASYQIDADALKLYAPTLPQFPWLTGTHAVVPSECPGGRHFRGSEFEAVECAGTFFQILEP